MIPELELEYGRGIKRSPPHVCSIRRDSRLSEVEFLSPLILYIGSLPHTDKPLLSKSAMRSANGIDEVASS